MKTPVVSFIGSSNSGKTTLLELVVIELKSQGYRVAIIKHTYHSFEIDQPGKDTWRFAQAGGDIVIISSPDKVAFIEQRQEELPLTHIETLCAEKADIIITEGYKDSFTPKVIVLRGGESPDGLAQRGTILGTVRTRLLSTGMTVFSPDDVDRIVHLLVRLIDESRQVSPGELCGTVSIQPGGGDPEMVEILTSGIPHKNVLQSTNAAPTGSPGTVPLSVVDRRYLEYDFEKSRTP